VLKNLIIIFGFEMTENELNGNPTERDIYKTIDTILIICLIATWIFKTEYIAILDVLLLIGLTLNYWLYKIYEKLK